MRTVIYCNESDLTGNILKIIQSIEKLEYAIYNYDC